MDEIRSHSKNLLIVDDDPQVVHVIELMIHKICPQDRIETAFSYKEAVARLESTYFDLIICDYNLIDGTGKMVLERVSPPTYRIGISGMNDESAFHSKCDTFLHKPFSLKEIQHVFQNAKFTRLFVSFY